MSPNTQFKQREKEEAFICQIEDVKLSNTSGDTDTDGEDDGSDCTYACAYAAKRECRFEIWNLGFCRHKLGYLVETRMVGLLA